MEADGSGVVIVIEKKFSKYKVLLGVLCVFIVLGAGCLQETPTQETLKGEKGVFIVKNGEKGGAPSPPMSISLSMPTTPALNEVAEVTATVSSIYDEPNTTAEIVLPEGVTLVSGDLTWEGDLKADVPVSFSANIMLTKTENIRIEAVAKNNIDGDNSRWDTDVIYLYYSVSQEVGAEQVESSSGKSAPPPKEERNTPIPPSVNVTK